ncbi:MAG: EAL domain-containing protein [Candidatus Thiodiazotropha taylori]
MQLILKVVVSISAILAVALLMPDAHQVQAELSLPGNDAARQITTEILSGKTTPKVNYLPESVSGVQSGTVLTCGAVVIGLLLMLRLIKGRWESSFKRYEEIAQSLSEGNYLAVTRLPVEGKLAPISRVLRQLVSENFLYQQTINQQKRVYAALSETSKMVLMTPPPLVMYQHACEIAVNFGGFTAAWVGEVDIESKLLHPVACAGIPKERLKVCKFDLDLTDPEGDSPLATAVYGKCASVIDRIDPDGGKTTWHRLAQTSGGQSVAVFPVVVNQDVIAAFTLYADGPDYFTQTIHDLLDEMVSNFAFAIENHERSQAHQLAHSSLEESSKQLAEANKQLSMLLESTGEGIFGVDENDNCTFINKAGAEMLGYTQQELISKPIHKQVRMFDESGLSFNSRVVEQGDPVRVRDESFQRQNETLFPVEYSTYPIMEDRQFKGSVTVFRDVTSSRSMMREMRFLATHDSLTHLLNRHAFDQRLRQAFSDSKEHNAQHVLLYMDLDQFKLVNDTCGHVAGDMMLRQLSHRLQRTIGENDVIARLGGDEFGLLMENSNLPQATQMANLISSTVKAFRFAWEGRSFTTGVSIGIVAIGPKTESTHNALSAADAACYVAKDMGRNRIHVYQPYDEEINRQQGEMRLVTKIESAIDQRRFSLLQQPIMSLNSSAIGDEHIELLVRMQDEEGTMIMPGAFIPAAERYNIMHSVDRWVIGEAFRWLSENRERLEELSLCAINLSGQSLGEATLHEYILEQLRHYGLPAEKISFEITETAVVSRLDQATRFISLLKRRGFRFALDDFGTGMSSFAYLKHLPVDYLKIDGSFVRNMMNDPVDRAMVESINQIGHLMGLKTIAEYVEDDQTLEQLIDIGVDYAQGFGVVQPMPLNDSGGDRQNLSPGGIIH